MAINRYTQGINNSLEQYVPLPFQEMMQAGQMIQQRGDLAEQQNMQTEFGLSSMEALAPAYKEFVNSYVNDYRKQSAELLDKVGGNTSNPDFVRGIKRLNTQFTSDPRLQIIKQGNEQIKQNQQIAAKMQAEGRLFINPEFTGKDDQGNLIANPGQIQGVNTLDEWTKAGAIAHSSMINDGKGTVSNRSNLNSWKKAVLSDVDGQNKLRQAYISQGYTPIEAQKAVENKIQGMINQFGVRSDRDWAYDNYQLAVRKAKAESDKSEIDTDLGTYFVPTQGEVDKQADNEIPLAGKSNVNFNTPFKGVLSGERVVFKKGAKWGLNDEVEKKSGSVNIKDGTFVNVSVPYVIKEVSGGKGYENVVGNILSKDAGWWTAGGLGDGTSRNINIEKDNKGNFVYLDDNKKVKGYLQPQAFAVYKDNESDATIYKKLNRDETLTYLGPQAGKLSNDGYGKKLFSTSKDLNFQKQIIQGLMSKGYDVNKLSPSQVDDLTEQLIDEAYYNRKKVGLFDPGKTTSFNQNYFGQ